ncbi:MAG: DUF4350 domain-containing protein [Chitinophagia bacterium]|nr:DUF4350 domain-containing protein [Chitinophagia bacterium]
MRWIWVYVIVLSLILAGYVYVQYRRPPRVDWSPTLSRFDKIPFGTWVLFHRLRDLFDTSPTTVRTTFYDHLRGHESFGEAFIVIARELRTGKADETEMLRYVTRGNTLFLAAETFSPTLADTLGFDTDTHVSIGPTDSVSLRLVNPAFGPQRLYPMLRGSVDTHFDRFDTARTTVLGMTDKGLANFISIPVGKGHILLHTAPLAFSNIALLRGDGYHYAGRALSYLPESPVALFWDDYHSIGLGGPTTPLRVILSRDPLRHAYQAALTAVALFLLFRSKRRQRLIPVVVKPSNTTMEFVDTVTRLYIDRADHRDIALKKIGFLLDQVRSRFGIPTGMLDESFVQRLAAHSGATQQEVRDLVRLIEAVRSATSLVEPELMHLSRTIDTFQQRISP